MADLTPGDFFKWAWTFVAVCGILGIGGIIIACAGYHVRRIWRGGFVDGEW